MKNLLITGATSGIDLETALELSRQGNNIHIVGRNQDRINETLSALKLTKPKDNYSGFWAIGIKI